jgi:hypothetical protein
MPPALLGSRLPAAAAPRFPFNLTGAPMSNPTTTMPSVVPAAPVPGTMPVAPVAPTAPAAPAPAAKPAKAPRKPKAAKAEAPAPAPFAMPPYSPRVRQPTMVLAMGPVTAKSGIRGWLQSQLAAVLAANGTKTCTVQQWVDQVVANHHLCNTKCKPAKLSAWDSFCNGYLRRHLREQEIRDGAALVAKPAKAPAKS